jgi:hypothetical protein
MQSLAYAVAWRTPVQGAAATGAFQRSSPTGGRAYGTPFQDKTPSDTLPATTPAFVRTSAAGAAAATAARDSAAIAAASHLEPITPSSAQRVTANDACRLAVESPPAHTSNSAASST